MTEIREIYNRRPDDPNYAGDYVLEHNDIEEEIISQVKMLLSTGKGEILGSYGFGTDIEALVFTTGFSSGKLEKYINDKIMNFIAPSFPGYSISCKVSFGHHPDGYDYSIIDIYINNKPMMGVTVV